MTPNAETPDNQPQTPAPNTPPRDHLERALQRLGYTIRKWKHNTLTARIDGKRTTLDIPTLLAAVPTDTPYDDPADATEPDRLTIALACALNTPIPDDALTDPTNARPILRPRLLQPQQLTGPARTACRREAFHDLLDVVSLGPHPNALLLRTEHLDRWNTNFEDVLTTADSQLQQHITTDNVHTIEDAHHVHAIVHPTEHTAPAFRFLHNLLPPADPSINKDAGVLFSLPARRTLLALPVTPDAGARALASLVQTTFLLTHARTDTETPAVYWKQTHTITTLPLTHVAEDDQARVHLDATNDVQTLLTLLGEAPPPQHPD